VCFIAFFEVVILPILFTVSRSDYRCVERIFYFGLLSVQFFEKTRIRFGMTLVWFGSRDAVWFSSVRYYSYLLLM